MAYIIIKPGHTWEETRTALAQTGIILTHRPHKKGGFVCYASKALRESLRRLTIND